MRKDISDIIQSNHVCVLATVSDGKPHCSLMSYVADADSREIYMITQRETKKYRNLAGNPAVSLLIDTRQTDSQSHTKALTITGIFQGTIDENKKSNIRTSLLKKNNDLKAFVDDPSVEIIFVQVKAVQLLDGIKNAYFENVT